jgi:hypothetical protein
MSKFLVTVLCSVFAVFCVVPEAKALTSQCDQCTKAQMEAIAGSRIQDMRSYGPLYVVDLYGGVTRKYEYTFEWAEAPPPEPDSGQTPESYQQYYKVEGFVQVAVEYEIQSQVADVSRYIRVMGVSTVPVPPHDTTMPSDPYQAINESRFDARIDQYIKGTYLDEINHVADFFSAFSGNGSFFDARGLYYVVRLVWPDGGSSVYQWDSQLEGFKYLTGTARDGQGNKIPETRQEVAGEIYSFSISSDVSVQDDFNDMWRRLELLGVAIVDMRGSGAGGSGNVYVYTCNQNNVCTVVTQ